MTSDCRAVAFLCSAFFGQQSIDSARIRAWRDERRRRTSRGSGNVEALAHPGEINAAAVFFGDISRKPWVCRIEDRSCHATITTAASVKTANVGARDECLERVVAML